LARYVGKWHEIASFPMFFQRKCTGNTTAEYARNSDGSVAVTNRCDTADAAARKPRAEATAAATGTGNAQARSSFFRPFRADSAWVIGLDPTTVGPWRATPTRNYLWALHAHPACTDLLDAAPAQRQDARL
jgi:apolipoprotein D and lipocalin family protein